MNKIMAALGNLRKLKIIDITIVVVFFSFIVAYFVIAFYNRAMQDDFIFYDRVISLGIAPSVADLYMHFEGAFAGFFWIHLFAYINQYSTHVLLINLINIFLLFGSLFLLLAEIIKNILPYYSIKIAFYLCILMTTSILYFQKDVIQESVFWFNGSTAYMSTVSWFMLGVYFLFKNGYLNFAASSVLLFLFAATRLHYSLIELGILLYFLVWYFLVNKRINMRIGLVLLIATLGFFIYLAAPGNYAGRFNTSRQVMLLHIPFTLYVKQIMHSLIFYFYVHILKILPLLSLNFALAFFLGIKDERNQLSKFTFLSITKFSVYAISISWLSLAVVMAMAQQGAGPSRTFFFPLFVTVIAMSLFFYSLGIYFKVSIQFFSKLTLPVGLIASGYFIYFLCSDLNNLNKFRTQFDQRIDAIVRAKSSLTATDTLYLDVLPFTNSFMNNESRGDFWIVSQQDDLRAYYKPLYQIKLVSATK